MFEEKWTPKKTHKGILLKAVCFHFLMRKISVFILKKISGNEWKGPPQFENKDGDLMMLSTDLALVEDPGFKVWAEKYYKGIHTIYFSFFVYTFFLNQIKNV